MILINHLINQKNVVFVIILDKYFNHEPYLCNGCNDMMMKAVSFKDVAIGTVKGNSYRINFSVMSKNDAIYLPNNSVLNNKRVL